MKVLDRREENSEAILQGLFIRDQLLEESKDFGKRQESLMASRGFRSSEWYDGRSFSILENRLEYNHYARHRFVDMKSRQTKSKGKIKKKSHPVHNRQLFGAFNNIIKRLHYGFTEAVKEQLSNREL